MTGTDHDGLARHIGRRMRARRSAERLTLHGLSDRVGVHLDTVHKLEKGTGTIMLRQIEMLLDALGLELAVVPKGHREAVENWAGWSDPAVFEAAREASNFDERALLTHVGATTPRQRTHDRGTAAQV